MTVPPHMRVSVAGHGQLRLPSLVGALGGSVTVYESSQATPTHIWLSVQGLDGEARVMLSPATAAHLVEQLRGLIEAAAGWPS